MENISNRINIMFQNLFITKKMIHPFFLDIMRVNKISYDYILYQKQFITNMIDFDINTIVPNGITINSKYKILKKNDINCLEKEMNNVMNWKKILKIVSHMSQYLLESNVKDEHKLYKEISIETNVINIMIIGTGPVGLYLACYLHSYYNMMMGKSTHVNIILYDNRVDKPGFRKPYNRHRPFATNSRYLSLIIPKIYCWNDKTENTSNTESFHINIFMLEYLLYTTAISKYNIKIIYNNYNWEDYLNIIEKGNFKIIFDCTGGKLKKHNINNNINNKDKSWVEKFKPMDGMKLDINVDNNLVTLSYNSKKFKQNFYYGSLSVYNTSQDINDKVVFVNKYDIDITSSFDLKYINMMKGKYFTFEEINTIIKGIKDDTARNFLYSIIKNKSHFYKNMIFTLDCWSIYIRHAIKISDTITINNRKVLYIGAGDTIFHSHFIVGAGLNRILDFTVKCANIIESIIN